MKRVITALAALALVAALCTLVPWWEQGQLSALLALTDDLQAACDRGDTAACRRLAQQLVDDCHARTRYFPFFLRHDDVAELEDTVALLPALCRSGDVGRLAVELARCRSQLEHLSRMEIPSPGNIL